MCIRTIVDTNVLSTLRDDDDTSQWDRLSAWIRRGDGLIVFTDAGRFAEEINKVEWIRNRYVQWEKNGRLIKISHDKVREAQQMVDHRTIKSDDLHVLGLALAGKVVVLHSNDKKLCHDFKNLGAVHGVTRSVYPHEAAAKRRNQFLRTRRCGGS